jgi:Zn-finger protein
MKMGSLCIERQKSTQINSCINCRLYRKNKCQGDIEVDLLRQKNNGYELYYPLQEILKDLGLFMLSTEELLKKLAEEKSIKMDRTLLFKYAKYGFIEKEKKTSEGKGKGVKTYWKDSSADKIEFIREFKDTFNIKLKDIAEYIRIIKCIRKNYFSEDMSGNKKIIEKPPEEDKKSKAFLKKLIGANGMQENPNLVLLMKTLAVTELDSAGYLKGIDFEKVWESIECYSFSKKDNYSEVKFSNPVNKTVKFSSSGTVII